MSTATGFHRGKTAASRLLVRHVRIWICVYSYVVNL